MNRFIKYFKSALIVSILLLFASAKMEARGFHIENTKKSGSVEYLSLNEHSKSILYEATTEHHSQYLADIFDNEDLDFDAVELISKLILIFFSTEENAYFSTPNGDIILKHIPKYILYHNLQIDLIP